MEAVHWGCQSYSAELVALAHHQTSRSEEQASKLPGGADWRWKLAAERMIAPFSLFLARRSEARFAK